MALSVVILLDELTVLARLWSMEYPCVCLLGLYLASVVRISTITSISQITLSYKYDKVRSCENLIMY